MSVFKIFPQQTATLYSYYPNTNTGLDEILDISLYNSISDTNEVSRALIQFSQNEINNVINNLVSGSQYSASLNLYLANASEIPLIYYFEIAPVSSSWNMGTGRASDSPTITDGASWTWSTYLSGSIWKSSSFASNVTASFLPSNPGGGDWYYNYITTQSFSFHNNKDIEVDVTNIVKAWFTGSINNNGFIIRNSDLLEFTTSSYFETKYFSDTTHTIYPPSLEIKWNDAKYSSSLSVVSSSQIVVSLGNNVGEYQTNSVQCFRVNVRDQYPIRTFQTSSLYLNNKILPPTSYWSIIDLDSGETVIDYDTNYTLISADSNGNYFTIYMNGLEPSRYYKILIQSVLYNGETLVSDNNYIFKVIQNNG
jgi:hypothetical protein